MEVELNGVSVSALFDSGASSTIVDSRLIADLKLGNGRGTKVMGVGGIQTASFHSNNTLVAGGLRLASLDVAAMDLSPMEMLLDRPMAVVFGSEAFHESIVDIDYPRLQIAFRPRDFKYNGPGTRTKLHTIEPNGFAVELEVEEGARGLFAIDTGSDGTLTIFDAFTRHHSLLKDRSPTSTTISLGIGGMMNARTGTLSSLNFGATKFVDIPATFFSGKKGVFALERVDGNIGSGLLSRFRLIFDTERSELIAEAGPDVDREFRKNRSGLHLLPGPSSLDVLHVSEGSPAAEAGWRAGDRVLALDGVSIDELPRAAILSWSSGPVGTRVLLIDGDGVERELILADFD